MKRTEPSPRRKTGAKPSTPSVNYSESTLSWLRSRKDRGGKPLISDAQYLAGERLRQDFERAMLAKRTTMNWDMAGAGGRSSAPPDFSDAALAAKERYHRAMEAVGPELASILHQVCCMAAGIEQAERILELPQRSGKAVLGLGLTALARHYGLLLREGRHATAAWALDDYRPRIPQTELEEA
jgi:hypothetical protein